MTTSDPGVCLRCGNPRMVGAAFCPACGQAYVSPSIEASVEPSVIAPAAASKKGLGTPERLVIGLIVVAVIIGGYILLNNRTGATVSAEHVPPTGQIWFGSAYDPTTFALTNQSPTQPVGHAVALVASLTRPTRTEYLTVNLSTGGQTFPFGAGQMTPGNTLIAYLIQPGLLTGGQVQVTVTDPGGNVLASGTVTAQ